MDYKKYSIALESIIKDIDLPDHTRILVDRLVNLAKRDAQENTDLLNKASVMYADALIAELKKGGQ